MIVTTTTMTRMTNDKWKTPHSENLKNGNVLLVLIIRKNE